MDGEVRASAEHGVASDRRDDRAGERRQPLADPADHSHATIRAGGEREFVFRVSRAEGTADQDLRALRMSLQQDYLAEGFRYSIPEIVVDVPVQIRLDEPRPGGPGEEWALRLDGDGWVEVESGRASPRRDAGSALTLECWLHADGFDPRTGLVCKTESSEYGIFVSGGRPSFLVHVGGQYLEIRAAEAIPEGVWQHVAGVYDGREARLYVGGRLVASGTRQGRRTVNTLPLLVGADDDGEGGVALPQWIDAVRLSSSAVYTGSSRRIGEASPRPGTCCF